MTENDNFVDALVSVRDTTRTRTAADRAWRQAIKDAHDAGVPIAHIAKTAGITRQGVYAILDGATDRAAGR